MSSHWLSVTIKITVLTLNCYRLYRDTEQKMQVMRQSVEKVEGAVYGLVVRGSERPKGWVPELGGGGEREAVESF